MKVEAREGPRCLRRHRWKWSLKDAGVGDPCHKRSDLLGEERSWRINNSEMRARIAGVFTPAVLSVFSSTLNKGGRFLGREILKWGEDLEW